jgi:hypothetical protein
MASGNYYKLNNDSFMPYQSFFLNNYTLLLRHSVLPFKEEEPTVHLTNVEELLPLTIRSWTSTVFTTSLIFDIEFSAMGSDK